MPDTPRSPSTSPARSTLRDAGESDRGDGIDRGPGDTGGSRAVLATTIPRRPRVSGWLAIALAFSFAALVTPLITAERWLLRFEAGMVTAKHEAPFTVRAPMLAGYENLRVRGGVVVARGDLATRDEAAIADAIADATPRGPMLYLALFALTFVLAAIFTHHMRRSTKGRLIRVQVVSLAGIAVLAALVKVVLASTAVSALVVPVAVIAMVPTMVLDRVVGLATGVLAALVVAVLAPFDVGLAILLLVQVATAGLVITERPKRRWVAALGAGLAATLCTGATYVLLTYLTTGQAPELHDPLHSAWVAAAIGPALAAVLAVPLMPIYQLLVGEITQGKLFALEDLGHPLLRQIAERSPGTWQHSLMMANMAEIAANAIGANGRLVRVGAYFHDLGKSLQPKYFIENLGPGETSPHDKLPPEVSCDAIFAHVTEGIVAARKAGLHERIVDFMHMHHGDGVLEYFWAKCREQGNPSQFTIEQFRYPGHPPQSRETALLAICDAVEAASRTLKKPDPAAIDSLVQRIVYGKLHLGQLDESGLSMSDLRRISDSLRETIRHANHGRIEYPWQKAGQDASASVMSALSVTPRLDSLDRKPARETTAPAVSPRGDLASSSDAALAATADVKNPDASRARDAAGRAGSEAGDAAKIRPGTARNAHPPAPVAGSAREASRASSETDVILLQSEAIRRSEPARAPSASDDAAPDPGQPIWMVSASGSPIGEAAPAARQITTIPGRAPGPLPPPYSAEPAPLPPPPSGEPAPRQIATIPGRAPGPVPPPSSGEPVLPDAVAAVPSSAPRPLPPPDLTTAQTFGAEPRPPAKKRASTLPPVQIRRPPTPAPPTSSRRAATSDAPPMPPGRRAATSDPLPTSSRRAATSDPVPPPASRRAATTDPGPAPASRRAATSDPARAAGPPAPVDLENAITNPPPLRRGPSGHPPVPSDPVQLAAALASTIARAGTAPFAMPPDEPRPPEGRLPAPDDASATPASASRPDVDAAITQPTLPRSPAAADLEAPIGGAPLAARGDDAPTPRPTRPSGLDEDRRPRVRNTLRGVGDIDDERATLPKMPTSIEPSSANRVPPTLDDPPREPSRASRLPPTVVYPPAEPSAASRLPPTIVYPPGDPWPANLVPPTVVYPPGEVDSLLRLAGKATGTPPRVAALDDESRVTAPRTAAPPPARQSEPAYESVQVVDESARAVEQLVRAADEPVGVPERHSAGDLDAGVTQPSMPVLAVGDERRIDLALPAPPPTPAPVAPVEWSSGLAARIDAAIDSDEWANETPIVAPSKAELRALLGQPDPTRQQPIDEIAMLQRRAAELAEADPPRRSPHPTAEVDPDDIEAAIELAPPARRPATAKAIGVAKPRPKKPE